MVVLKTIGLFYITSEKIDDYVPEWVFPVGAVGFIGAMLWMFFHLFTRFGVIIPPEWGLRLTLVIVISVLLIIIPPVYYTNRCGISITLIGTKTPLTTKFALSNDASRDAKKIKKIVDKYTKLAYQLDVEQKSKEAEEKKLKEECCTRYQEVMQKVKTE